MSGVGVTKRFILRRNFDKIEPEGKIEYKSGDIVRRFHDQSGKEGRIFQFGGYSHQHYDQYGDYGYSSKTYYHFKIPDF